MGRPRWASVVVTLLLAATCYFFTGANTGCSEQGTAPPPPTITGIVQNVYSAQNWNALSKTWSAVLHVDTPYNGSYYVNIGNDGNDQDLFDNFIHNGDTLTIVVYDSLNSMQASWVTVNGQPLSSFGSG